MKKLRSLALAALGGTVLAGCAAAPSALETARAMIRAGEAECVLLRDGKIAYVEHGRGVSPLLSVYDRHRPEMKNAVLADKVIGRAAAAIAICGGVSHVHGEIMSEDAVTFLRDNGVTCTWTLLVPRILNRKRDGLCPLEQSVEGIVQPDRALAALRQKIASFQRQSTKANVK